MKQFLKVGLTGILFVLAAAMPVVAQVEIGVDVASRYVWRGTDFGSSPSVQPDISISFGALTIGSWAAIATNGNPAGSEIDFYATYSIETGAGTFDLVFTDYTFPDIPKGEYFTSEAHFIELGLGYSGTESLPLSFFMGSFVTNDNDYSIYAELGYSVGAVDLMLGFTPAASALYGTTKAGIINTGLSTSKEFTVSESFGFSLSSSLIFNPYAKDAFFLVGISF